MAASAAAAVALTGSIQTVVLRVAAESNAIAAVSPKTQMVTRPLNSNCSGGYVTFTFDDGPREHTERLLDTLDLLGIKAVFFWNGQNIGGRERTVARAVAEGHIIGNHSWDHADLTTGKLPDGTTVSWTDEWVRGELERTNAALIAAGAPRPTLYRPPYGSTNRQVEEITRELGLRLVSPWGNDTSDNIVDSRDSEGANTQEIIDNTIRWMRNGSIITMHDGQGQGTLNSIHALQSIVDAMNQRGLCTTTEVREDATGHVLQMYG
ncbi:peptidoglycan/xylan/chitin deacetylase (PgdA/CDA1 family) [Pseudarthrobacter defluvii]|uniref:Peptidoglycan/xylan/chitin deacetylase (PgdA/CDA1 family) n=1 Tax=Pseudarthrobacter defluvii TaxID=410837 RepID=A0ABT9UEH8_9MICC|nr:polysaccharide deacetylase family protein [Pseudarthrobacter defluvii]MDQ0118035.1 peptidoglycan/xylan/chitin deacetylase (PgdA/CDA1 family) [Pseudarthrobacter defluvii]